MSPVDTQFMRLALREARRGVGRTSPNPAVGAVIVREGRPIGAGYHRKAGFPHAEAEVLAKLGGKAEGATLYVTLEPCNHFGKTPPCTEAILKSGLRRVVVGMKDPNPSVSGGGCDVLKKHGIKVTTGVLEEECRRLNEDFVKFITTRRPFVIVKSALTINGWTATSTGHSKWVTKEESRQFVHRLRDRVDAVLVGVGTILADDPRLTTRLKRGRGRDPARIVVDTHLRVPRDARVLSVDSSAETWIAVGPEADPEAMRDFRRNGVPLLVCPTRESRVDMGALMDKLGKMSVMNLLVEGGAAVIGSLLRERLIDKFCIFKAPKILGGDDGTPMAAGPGPRRMDRCCRLKDIQIRRFGEDVLLTGYPEYQDSDDFTP